MAAGKQENGSDVHGDGDMHGSEIGNMPGPIGGELLRGGFHIRGPNCFRIRYVSGLEA